MAGERLHPESVRTLRDLVRLHGAARTIAAVREIERQEEQQAPEIGNLFKT